MFTKREQTALVAMADGEATGNPPSVDITLMHALECKGLILRDTGLLSPRGKELVKGFQIQGVSVEKTATGYRINVPWDCATDLNWPGHDIETVKAMQTTLRYWAKVGTLTHLEARRLCAELASLHKSV